MHTHSVRRSLFAFAVVGALAPVALLDCTSSNSGAGSGNPDGGVCPSTAPTSGSACFAAEGTMCSGYAGLATPGCYCCNGGGSSSFTCTMGKWQELAYASGGGAPNNFAACPAIIPTQGSPCMQSCGGAQQSCSYDCDTGQGRAASATCLNGSWNVAQLGLACPVDGGADASDAADGAD